MWGLRLIALIAFLLIAVLAGGGAARGAGPEAGVPVVGLVNPLGASPRPVANGSHATPAARLRIRFVRSGRRPASQVSVLPTRPALITGTVRDPAGRPIGGAVLVIVVQVDGEPVAGAVGLVRSDGRGHISFALPAGPSRSVALAYFPASATAGFVASNAVHYRLATVVRLAVSPHLVRAGRRVHFRGQIVGVRGGELLVALQVLRTGAGFQTFRVVRSRPSGRFDAAFRFARGVRAAYRFRALVIDQNGFPYGTSVSHSTFVVVM